MTSIELRCACGEVRGTADFSFASQVHVHCHCGDCRAYADWLGRDDAREVVQTTPARVRITSGASHVRCVKRSEKGLLRFYATCCKTPLANSTRGARAPFVGLMCCTLATRDDAILGTKVDV